MIVLYILAGLAGLLLLLLAVSLVRTLIIPAKKSGYEPAPVHQDSG